MLKNKVKNVLKRKFDFNPYTTNNIVKEITIAEINDTEIEPVAIATESIYIDIPNYLISPSFKKTRPLMLCVFRIITNESYPLLLYLLIKDEEHELNFIKLNDGRNNKQIKYEAIDYVSKIMCSEISYAGFCETNENNIIFLKSCNKVNNIPSNYYWATPHELVNLKTVINLPINKVVVRFFMDNLSLLILKNEDNRQYISPVIGYYSTTKLDPTKLDTEKNDYSYVDIFSEKVNDALGNYYSFYLTMPSKSDNNVIMRAALFLVKPSLNTTLTKTDSIIFNKYKDRIRYAIKNYNQHMPLSYH